MDIVGTGSPVPGSTYRPEVTAHWRTSGPSQPFSDLVGTSDIPPPVLEDGAQSGTSGLDLEGHQGFARIEHGAAFSGATGTIGMWARTTAPGTAQGLFSKIKQTWGIGEFFVRLEADGRISVLFENDYSGFELFTTVDPVVTGTDWFHVALSWGGGEVRLHVNGQQVSGTLQSGGTDDHIDFDETLGGIQEAYPDFDGNDEPLVVGAVLPGTGNPFESYFDGHINDVTLFNRALSDDELAALGDAYDADALGPLFLPEPPAAANDQAATLADAAISIDVLDNDAGNGAPVLDLVELNGQTIAAGAALTLPSGATVTLEEDGTLTYDPTSGFSGLASGNQSTDSFSYTVRSAQGTDTASVSVVVTGTATGNPDTPDGSDGGGDEDEARAPGDRGPRPDEPDEDDTDEPGVPQIRPEGFLAAWSSRAAAFAGSDDSVAGTPDGVGQNGAGLANGMVVLDGVNDHLSIGHADLFNQPEGALGLWFKTDTLGAEQGIVGKIKNGWGIGEFFAKLESDGRLTVLLENGFESYSMLTTRAPVVTPGTWHHLMLAWEGGEFRAYIDGQQQSGQRSQNGSPDGEADHIGFAPGGLQESYGGEEGNSQPLLIGAILPGTGNPHESYLDGMVGEVSLFGTVPDADTLAELVARPDRATLIDGEPNIAPVALDDTAATTEVGRIVVDVLANDTDANSDAGDALTLEAIGVVEVTGPFSRSFFPTGIFIEDNKITFDPGSDFRDLGEGITATVSIGYVVSDTQGSTATATLDVTLTGLDNTPVSRDDSFTIDADGILKASVLTDNGAGPDEDQDGDPFIVASVNGSGLLVETPFILPSGALLLVNDDGTFTFNPNSSFAPILGETLTDSFTYRLADATASSTVTVSIEGINSAPEPAADSIDVGKTDTATISVLANDVDVDGQALSVTALNGNPVSVGETVTLASGAKLTLLQGGTFSYDPFGVFDELQTGQDETDGFSYTVTDGLLEATADVSIGIIGQDDPQPEVGTNPDAFTDWQRHVIDADKPWRSVLVTAGDIDGDGLKDVITGPLWYKNPGDLGGAWSANTIGSPLNNMGVVHDFDGDGDLDILGTDNTGDNFGTEQRQLVWAENDGTGQFTIRSNIDTTPAAFLQGTSVNVFSDGGPLQIIVSWENPGVGIQRLTVPDDPVNGTWTWDIIDPEGHGEDVATGDLDGDGDTDILAGARYLRNDGGTWTSVTIDPDAPEDVEYDRAVIADLDRDGRLDAVVSVAAFEDADRPVLWFEQPDTPDGVWTKRTIGFLNNSRSLDVKDVDGDGDLDVIAGEHSISDPDNPELSDLVIFENTDTFGTAWTEYSVYQGDEHHDATKLFDLDNDRDLDIVSIGWTHGRVAVYENLSGVPAGSMTPVLTDGSGGPVDPDGDDDADEDGSGDGMDGGDDMGTGGDGPVWDGLEFPETLAAFWALDGGTYDERLGAPGAADGLGLNGVILSGATLGLDGENDHVEIAHGEVFNQDEGTLSVWVKTDALGETQGLFSKITDSWGIGEYFVQLNPDGSLTVLFENGFENYATLETQSPVITAGTWHNVALTWGDGQVRLYVDGALQSGPRTNNGGDEGPHDHITFTLGGQQESFEGNNGNSQPLVLGAILPGTGHPAESYLDGMIDGTALFDTILSGQELADLAADADRLPLPVGPADDDGADGDDPDDNGDDPESPQAKPDLGPVAIGGTVVVDILSNDGADEGLVLDPSSVSIIDQPVNGTLVIDNVTGDITYTHTGAQSGVDEFTYTVEDENGLVSNAALVRILIGESTARTWTRISTETGEIPQHTLTQATAAQILDVDKDGLNDFVIAGNQGGESIHWYRRTDSGWDRIVIESEDLPIEAGGAFEDIDGDGDLDLLFGGDFRSDKIWWWENPYPVFDPEANWTRHEIKSEPFNVHHDSIFADFDGDGQAELVTWNQASFFFDETNARLKFAEIPSDPTVKENWTFTEFASGFGEGIAAADLDGDGQTDLIAGGRWFRHVEGAQFEEFEISTALLAHQVAAGDLDEDGDIDLVFSSGDLFGSLVWAENDGTPEDGGWTFNTLVDVVERGHSVEVVDFDNDGHLDIYTAEMRLNGENDDARVYVFWGDGTGAFEQTTISEGIGSHESTVGDLDGDGDIDILGKPFNWDTPRLDIWLNNLDIVPDADDSDDGDDEGDGGDDGGGGDTPLDIVDWENWDRIVIDDARPWRSIFITPADINGDGYEDLVAGGWWWKNPGEDDGGWVRNTIGSPLNNMATVHDFDDDGDLDIIGTGGQGPEYNDKLVWAQNDGSGDFTIIQNIELGAGPFLQGVTVTELQAGGPQEVILSWQDGNGGTQAVTVPDDPVNSVWQTRSISPVSLGEGIDHGDIDGDGDIDISLGFQWLRNDGADVFTPFTIHDLDPSSGEPDRVYLVDMDDDGDLDSLVGNGHDQQARLRWYEQPDDPTAIWTEHVIGNLFKAPQSVDYADIDNDGDIDVIAGEHNDPDLGTLGVFVYENVNGQSTEWEKHTVFIGDEHHDGTQLFDFDNDGDLDIASIGWTHSRVVIYENRMDEDSL